METLKETSSSQEAKVKPKTKRHFFLTPVLYLDVRQPHSVMKPLPLPFQLFPNFGFGPAERGIWHVCSAHCSSLIPHFSSSALPKAMKGFQTNKQVSTPCTEGLYKLASNSFDAKTCVQFWYDESHVRVHSRTSELRSQHFNCLGIIYRLQTAAVVVGHQWCKEQFVMLQQCSPVCLSFLIPSLIPLGWADKTCCLTHLLDPKHAGPPMFIHHYILQL